MHRKALLLRLPGDLPDGLLGRLLVGRPAPVERSDRVLVLAANAQALMLARVHTVGELPHARGPRRELRIHLGARGARAQQLATVIADVGDRADRDDLARGARRAGR